MHKLAGRAGSSWSSRPLPQQQYIENQKRYGGHRLQQEEEQRQIAARSDVQELLEHHRFVRDAAPSDLETWAKDTVSKAKNASNSSSQWAKKMTLQYDRHLFKEFALADMSRYKTGKVGLRWRTEREVISGKGESECANLACAEHHGLSAYEVNFAYVEGKPPIRKNTLVKLMLCPDCGYKLNYKKTRAERKKKAKKKRDRKRKTKKRKNNSKTTSRKGSRKRKVREASGGTDASDTDEGFSSHSS